MKIVLSGGGIVGLMLARLLRMRGFEPIVFERMKEGQFIPRGYMMGFQAYPPFEELGLLHQIRSEGWDIAPRPDQDPVAVCVAFGYVHQLLARDLPVEYEHSVVDLVRDDSGRIVGVIAEGPDGRKEYDSDLVVACDGTMSPVRQMAGLEAEFTPLAEAELGFTSTEPGGTSFEMVYLSDGGHIGTLGWPQGSGGWRSCARVGREAALAPGLDAIKEMWARLLPSSAKGVEGVESLDQIRYSEPTLLRCPRWWVPGLILIGDSAHFFGPETGVSSGIGFQDAQALAEAVRQNPNNVDAVCAAYEAWRVPAVRPLEDADPGRERLLTYGQGKPKLDEAWPPESA